MVKASITVGGKSESGGPSELEKLNNNFSNFFNFFKRASKLDMSGLGGGGGGLLGGGILRGLLAAGGGAGAALLGFGAQNFISPGGQGQILPGEQYSGISYEEALIDGERKILQVNDKTGEIERVLTEQEAIQEGILTETGKLKTAYNNWTSTFDELTKDLPKYRNNVILNFENMKQIVALTEEEKKLRRELNDALIEQTNMMSSNMFLNPNSPVRQDVRENYQIDRLTDAGLLPTGRGPISDFFRRTYGSGSLPGDFEVKE